jgi:hypothetical protein
MSSGTHEIETWAGRFSLGVSRVANSILIGIGLHQNQDTLGQENDHSERPTMLAIIVLLAFSASWIACAILYSVA